MILLQSHLWIYEQDVRYVTGLIAVHHKQQLFPAEGFLNKALSHESREPVGRFLESLQQT